MTAFKPCLTEAKKKKIRELYKTSGCGFIAKKLNVSISTVRRELKKDKKTI